MMFPIVLLGPDGAGKSTVTQRLLQRLPSGTQVVYMGVRLESSNRLLPSSRLILAGKRWLGWEPDRTGPPDPGLSKRPQASGLKGLASGAYGWLRVLNLLAEEWYRVALTAYHHARGRIVIFDRDFFADHYHHGIIDSSERSWAQRLHLWTLRRFYPRPALVIVLDAPAEVLLARKQEGTLAALESRRQEYLQLRDVLPRVEVVDAQLPVDVVVNQVEQLIRSHHPFLSQGRGDESTA